MYELAYAIGIRFEPSNHLRLENRLLASETAKMECSLWNLLVVKQIEIRSLGWYRFVCRSLLWMAFQNIPSCSPSQSHLALYTTRKSRQHGRVRGSERW
jgi:hypothetical protein